MQLRSKEWPYSFSAIELINNLMPQFPYTHTHTQKNSLKLNNYTSLKPFFLVNVTVSNIFYQSF